MGKLDWETRQLARFVARVLAISRERKNGAAGLADALCKFDSCCASDSETLARSLTQSASDQIGPQIVAYCLASAQFQLYRLSADERCSLVELAIRLATREGMTDQLGHLNFQLASAYQAKYEVLRAEAYYRAGMTQDSDASSTANRTAAIGSLANIASQKHDFTSALDGFAKALRTAEELHAELQSKLLCGLGVTQKRMGDLPSSIATLKRALETASDVDDECNALGNLGVVYREAGCFQLAEKVLLQRVKLAETIGDEAGLRNSVGVLGNVYSDQRQWAKAEDALLRALRISEKLCDTRGRATDLLNLGTMIADSGDGPRALDYFNRGLELFKEVGDRRSVGIALKNMAIVHADLGQFQRASDTGRNAIASFSTVPESKQNVTEMRDLLDAWNQVTKGHQACDSSADSTDRRIEITDHSYESALSNEPTAFISIQHDRSVDAKDRTSQAKSIPGRRLTSASQMQIPGSKLERLLEAHSEVGAFSANSAHFKTNSYDLCIALSSCPKLIGEGTPCAENQCGIVRFSPESGLTIHPIGQHHGIAQARWSPNGHFVAALLDLKQVFAPLKITSALCAA